MMILNNLKQQISNIINNSQLSIDAVYFVIKDIMNEIEKLYYLELQKEEQQKNLNNIKEKKEKEPNK